MKAICYARPWDVSCAEVPEPVRGAGEAKIRIAAAGICGSDIGGFRGTNKLITYPRIIGHELAGVIEEIDRDNPRKLKVGDRVIIDPYLYCGRCYPCRIGRTNCCTDLKVLGVHVEGGMAEYCCHPAHMLIPIPDEMDWITAAMVEPLTISLHGVHRGALRAGEYCVICGAGPIGLLAGMIAEAYGAHAIIIDLVRDRLRFAETLGIEYMINAGEEDTLARVSQITGGEMAQLVMECTGSNQCIRQALDLASFTGRITYTGWPARETSLPTDMITRKELDVRGARTSAGEFEEAVVLIRTGRVDIRRILTGTVSLEQVPETIRDIEKNPGRYMKVVADLGIRR